MCAGSIITRRRSDLAGRPRRKRDSESRQTPASQPVVKRVEGWQVCNTFQNDKIMCVFERLASEAGCDANTFSQLMNGARRFEDEVRSRVRRPVGANILNVAGGSDRGY